MYKKLRNILILLLLGIISVLIIKLTKENQNNIPKDSIKEVKAEEKTEDLYEQQKELNNILNKSDKLILSEGTLKIGYTFSTEDEEVMNEDDYMNVLHSKLFKQEIEYNTEYNYNYTYQIKDISIQVVSETILINIYDDKVRLDNISEDLEKTEFNESYGWIATDFTPKEIKAIQKRMYSKAYNYLITNEDLKNKSANNLKETLDILCKKLGIKNYNINIQENHTITNQDEYTEISGNNFNTTSIDINNE